MFTYLNQPLFSEPMYGKHITFTEITKYYEKSHFQYTK